MIAITGGTGRLGRELVKLYKAAGQTVISVARHDNPDADQNILCNLAESNEVVEAAEKIKSIDGSVEVIINAAGFYKAQALGEITSEGVKNNMAVHAEAPIILISNLIDKIKDDGTDIVNISSIAAINPSTGSPAYSASKSALRSFSADLRLALKETSSRVITLCPAAFGVEPEDGMNVKDIARFIKQTIDLPKNMEISEVVINMKDIK